MKIALGVDFPSGCAAGIEIWAQGLIEGLSRVDEKNEYFIFGFFMRNFQKRKEALLIPEKKNFQLYVKRAPKPVIMFLEKNNIPVIERWLINKRIDVFHGTGYFLPHLKEIKSITTIHGLDFAEMDAYWYSEKWFWDVGTYLKRACIVVAVSEYVKEKIRQYYGVENERIKVVYPGVNGKFRILDDDAACDFSERFKFPFPYIFTVATSFERKNLERLLKSFAILIRKNIEVMLVIAGSTNIEERLSKEVVKLGLQKNVYFAGYCDADHLSYLYNKAEVFVFPSLYEGFGLPVIEAMACGCPVITSNVSALPEVSGNAALLVNPYSVDQLAESMEKVLIDSQLRQRLRADGLIRAKEFSWEKSAEQMVEIYNLVCGKS